MGCTSPVVSLDLASMLFPKQNFSNLTGCIELTRELLLKMQNHGFQHRHADSVGLQWDNKICTFSKIPVAKSQALDD